MTKDEGIRLAAHLCQTYGQATPQALLSDLMAQYGERIALASSLGMEDQVLTDMMMKISPRARIFTIDTGRLFPETYQLIDKTCDRYHTKIEVFFPDHTAVEAYVRGHGINAFYESEALRKACCRCRKIEPLLRALSTLDVWVCGLRNAQSVTRTRTQLAEWDEANGLLKVNPIVHWSQAEVTTYVREHNVPVNKLHAQGFPSIGCQPCTRAVKPGEDIRAGRWWWEAPAHKECGLHRR